MFMKPKIKFLGLKSLSWQQTRFDCGWRRNASFSKWQDQPITDDPRYHTIVNEMQDAARSNFRNALSCGYRKQRIGLQLMNQAAIFTTYFCAFY
jgi:carboxylate-amine ligase